MARCNSDATLRESAPPTTHNNSHSEKATLATAMAITMVTLVMQISGYILPHPHALTTRQCPPVPMLHLPEMMAPVSESATYDGVAKSATGSTVELDGVVVPVRDSIRSLSTVPELEEAMADAHSSGRLCVIKFYAPWCSACRVIQPKFKRLMREYPEHDFFQVDFSRCKPLSKHCDITMLPTGIILDQGKLVSHMPIRKADFQGFKERLAVHAEACTTATNGFDI